MPADAPRRRRGFTLVELLVVLAISSITLLAASMVFAAMLNQRRLGERTVEVYSSLAMAQGVMEYDISNAGWRFPSPAVAIRVINNVDTSTAIPDTGLTSATGTITTGANCSQSTWGLVPGSDVIELAEGYAAEANGTVLAADSTGFTIKGGTAPFTSVTGNPVVLFANPQGDIFLARAGGAAGPGGTVTYATPQFLNPDFTDNTTGSPPYAFTGPQPGMNVYRLGRRTRYLLCKAPGSGPDSRGVLFRQVSGDDGNLMGSTPPFQRIQDGVADLQVALRVADPGTHLTGGSSCMPAGAGQFCYCSLVGTCGGADLAGNSPSSFFLGPPLTTTSRASADQWVRGVMLGLTGVSTRPAAVGVTARNVAYLRPALMDHAVSGTAGDGYLYLTQQRAIALRNLTQVIP